MNAAADLSDTLKRYRFYHVIDLGNGIATPGNPLLVPLQAPVLEEIRRRDLQGKRVLDVGCRDGLFSFEAERRGGRVLAIDSALSQAAVAFLIPWFKSGVEMRETNLYDFRVEPHERFDFVIFAGVLYHLREPFHGLKLIADVMNPGGELLIETGLMLSHHRNPFVFTPAPKDSPYEPTSVSFFNHPALVATLESMGFEDVSCRAVISPSPGWPRYDSWETFLAGADGHLAQSDTVVVGRATYTCRRSADAMPAERELLQSYWYGTHALHADPQAANRLRAMFGFVPFEINNARVGAFLEAAKSDPPKRRGRFRFRWW
jgi:SAM-dependent methyltransferase